jgi:hypothetical protein
MIPLVLKAIGGFFARLPWQVYAAIALALILVVGVRTAYNSGRADVQAEWDASVERGKAIVKELELQRGTITTVTEIKHIDRVKVIREQAKTLEVVREVFVPYNSGMLSGGFRLYYDAAITGTVPDPARIADAPPVAVADVADTHNANAERCRVAYETVTSWQDWAAQQCAKNPNGCPPNG